MAEVRNLYVSLVRFVKDFIADAPSFGIDTKIEFVNFDAHAQLTSLPAADVVGISDFSFQLDEKFIHLLCGFGISTLNDVDLMRHIMLLDALFERLKPTKTIPVFDAYTTDKRGWMVVTDDVTLLPMANTETRGAQFLLVKLETDQTLTS